MVYKSHMLLGLILFLFVVNKVISLEKMVNLPKYSVFNFSILFLVILDAKATLQTIC